MTEPAYRLVLPDREDARAWPAQGKWTYDDYRLLPDDGRRYEVIRGHPRSTNDQMPSRGGEDG